MDYNYYPICNQDKDEMAYKFIIAINAVAILFNIVVVISQYDTGLSKKYDELQAKNEKDVQDYNKLVDEHNQILKQLRDIEAKNAKDVDDYNTLAESHNTLVDTVAELRSEIEAKDTRIQRLESRLDRNVDYKEE